MTNLDMEKQRLIEMDMDPMSFVCVNPYEINPIVERTHSPSQTLIIEAPPKDGPDITPQNGATTNRGMFYGCQGKIKLEMEEFSDLSLYVFPRPTSTNSVDELNTPIFEKNAFDFGVNNYRKQYYQLDETFVKLEHDYYGNTTNFIPDSEFKDNSVNAKAVHRNENTSSSKISNSHHLQNPTMNVFPPQSKNESAQLVDKISPSYDNSSSTFIYTVDYQGALSVNNNNDNCYSRVSSPEYQIQHIRSGLETPEDSNCSNELPAKRHRLSLDLSLKMPSNNSSTLTTPGIIEEVVDLEAGNFNILDIVDDEDIPYNINSEEIFNTTSTVDPSVLVEDTTKRIVQKKMYVVEKRPRKRRAREDIDEDYVPPSKRTSVQRRQRIVEDFSHSESDSDVDVEISSIVRLRGRPPKRTGSVSSDCSKGSDVSKYRELRDKNNEASRKSRLKRKLKDLEIEKEADELNANNIKLKAQVEELEKMVTNFRDNLFKIMIRK